MKNIDGKKNLCKTHVQIDAFYIEMTKTYVQKNATIKELKKVLFLWMYIFITVLLQKYGRKFTVFLLQFMR